MVGLALHMRLVDNKKNIEIVSYILSAKPPREYLHILTYVNIHTYKYTCTDSCTHAITVHIHTYIYCIFPYILY